MATSRSPATKDEASAKLGIKDTINFELLFKKTRKNEIGKLKRGEVKVFSEGNALVILRRLENGTVKFAVIDQETGKIRCLGEV